MRSSAFGWFAVLLALTALAGPARAEEINYKLVDTGVASEPKLGQGIEMRFTAESFPEGGMTGPALAEHMQLMCTQFAPQIIPFVREKSGIAEFSFLAVRVSVGGRFLGRYVREKYRIEGEGCGGVLGK